jgi:hypothetical protein
MGKRILQGIAALVIAVATVLGARELLSDSSEQRATRPPEARVPVTADLVLVRDPQGPRVSATDSRRLALRFERTAMLEIPRKELESRCGASMTLHVYQTEGPLEPSVHVYPGVDIDVGERRDGDRLGPLTLIDNRPRGDFDDASEVPGWRSADVTDIVRTWLNGSRFPSLGKRAPRTGPVVLQLRPEQVGGNATITYASSDGSPDLRPYLLMTGGACDA